MGSDILQPSKIRLPLWALLFAAIALVAAPKAWATSILLYDENTGQQNTQTALTNLGLPYTVAGASDFNSMLTGGSWDLVIMDLPSTTPSGGFGDLVNYVSGGGKSIMSFWLLQTEAALAGAFDVAQISSFGSPQDVYSWDGSHPIWSGVATLTSWSDSWADDGDRLEPLGGALALGGFTSSATTNEAAIVLGNSGRTIYNGFLFDELRGSNGIQLIENEISFIVSAAPVPEPASMALFGVGLAGLGLMRRKRAA